MSDKTLATQELKPGWKVWRFDQIAVNVNDRVEPGDTDLDHYVGLEHLDSESLTIRRWGSPDDVGATKLLFKKDDIILGRRRVYQRKLAVAGFDGICSAHAMVLRPRTEVVAPEFLPFFMQSDLFMNRAVEISVGSLSPTINWKTLARQEFALPPLAEQRRIAEVLWAVEILLESLTGLAASLSALYSSAVESSLSSDSVIGKFLLQERADVSYGLTVNQTRRKAHHKIPYLRVANVMRGGLDLNEMKEIGFSKEDEQYLLRSKDVLVVEGHANPEEIGRAALWNNEIDRCAHQNHLIRICCRDSLNPEYLAIALNSTHGRRHFLSHAKSTSGLNTINSKVVREVPLPDLALSQQQEIVDLTNGIRWLGQSINARYDSTKEMKKRFLVTLK